MKTKNSSQEQDFLKTVGLATGIIIISSLLLLARGHIASKITLTIAGGIFGTVLTGQILDEKFTKKLTQKDSLLLEQTSELNQLRKRVEGKKRLVEEMDRLNDHIVDLHSLIQEKEALIGESSQNLSHEKDTNQQLVNKITSLERTITELNQQIKQLEETWNQELVRCTHKALNQFKTNFIDEKLKQQVNFLNELYEQAKEFKAVTEESLLQARNSKDDTANVVESSKSLMARYHKQYQKREAAFVEKLEIAHEQVARLQQEAKGVLLEPVYAQQGYSIPAQIAASLCREVWNTHQIPLRLEGVSGVPDGVMSAGYGYGTNQSPDALVSFLKGESGTLCQALGIHKITKVERLVIAPVIAVSFRREPALKKEDIKMLLGTGEEFLSYVVNHPIRYRLIADPGTGKTPTTAVMLSAILKQGCKMGNVPSGQKVPHALVSVSYPDRYSSIKDEEYPLDRFLDYATTTEAVNSFDKAIGEWNYRKTHLDYAKTVFKIYCWDEFDNTISSASSPKDIASNLKVLLKQGGHSNIGWILSGQSVMTRQIPGFTNDDRSLFTEIIIGIPKIRKYLQAYGSKLGAKSNTKLSKNLDDIEEYISYQNKTIVDSARLLRVALVVDSKSPKLFLLPNLDLAVFDEQSISESQKVAEQIRNTATPNRPQDNGDVISTVTSTRRTEPPQSSTPQLAMEVNPTTTINSSKPHCPKCGSSDLGKKSATRYKCKSCNKTTAKHLVIWK